MLTGHCKLKQHLNKMSYVDDTTCRLCGLVGETAEHILCNCNNLAQTRLEIFKKPRITEADVKNTDVRLIVKFLKKSGIVEKLEL